MSQKKIKQQRKLEQKSKRRDLRILWQSNAPHANSGYSVFSRDLLFRLLKDGWIVACSGMGAGVDAYPVWEWGEDLIDDRFKGLKLKVYPKLGDPYGSDSLVDHSIDFKAHITFSMQDVWTLNPQYLQKMKVWISYVPIDKYPVPQNVLQNLQYAYKIITFSSFGQKALEEKGFTSTLILEGVDTQMFKPMDKKETRAKWGLPQDLFLFGMIGANKENPPRKGYQEALEAFALFQAKHPDSGIFFHTQQITPGGFPIQQLCNELKLKNAFFLDAYKQSFGLRSHDIAEELNCFDILLHPSRTEGFGLLPVEAMSCGIPAIVNNTTSMPEQIIPGKTGEICKTAKRWFTPDAVWVWDADIPDLYECMERLYQKLHEPNTIARDCREHVLTKYNIDVLFKDKWVKLLEELQDELLTIQQQPSIIQSTSL
ncbi:MAG: glycosyltransferase [Patescibacteria group bacterium]